MKSTEFKIGLVDARRPNVKERVEKLGREGRMFGFHKKGLAAYIRTELEPEYWKFSEWSSFVDMPLWDFLQAKAISDWCQMIEYLIEYETEGGK